MRPRKQQRHLPSCVYQRHGAYYLVKAGKWTRLGADLSTALAEYGRLQGQATGGMQELIETALPHITKGKAQATQDQYGVAARKLQGILADFSPQQVMPKHVAQMRRALADTPNMANRCITVLRLVFDYAVEEQLVDSNPCTGIKRLEEAKRDRLVLHDEFERIHEKAPPRLQLMMELAYLTGQRLMDVVGIHRAELKDDGIYFRQDKTNAQLVVRWTPQIRDVVERAKRLGGRSRASGCSAAVTANRPPMARCATSGSRPAPTRASQTPPCATSEPCPRPPPASRARTPRRCLAMPHRQ